MKCKSKTESTLILHINVEKERHDNDTLHAEKIASMFPL